MSADILGYIKDIDKSNFCTILVIVMAYLILDQSGSEIIDGNVDFFGLGTIPPYVDIILIFILFIILHGFCHLFNQRIFKIHKSKKTHFKTNTNL